MLVPSMWLMPDEPDSLAAQIGEALTEREETLAVAESATGGLICSTLTDIAGASEYFDRGFVTYAYEAKLAELGVTREILDELGAVSKPVALQMARGARDHAGTTWSVAVTGVAGPTGGSTEKPVGTMYIAVAVAAPWGTNGSDAWVDRHRFGGNRLEIKEAATNQALSTLLQKISQ